MGSRNAPKIRNLILFIVIFMMAFTAIVAYQGQRNYELALQDARKDAERLTRIVGDHVELTFLAVDLTLRRVVERQYFNDLFGGNLPRDLLNNLRLWVDENPQIAAMLMVNEHGEAVVAAHKTGYQSWIDYEQFDFRTAPFFYQMRDASDRFFWISILSSREGFDRDLILISRKINKIDGEFGGLVMAAIDPEYFVDFFESVGAGKHALMSMNLTDGTALVNGPERSLPASEFVPEILRKHSDLAHSDALHVGIMDTGEHIHAYAMKALRNLPLMVSVILDDSDVLQVWRQILWKDIGLLGIFLVFGAIVSFFAVTMSRQIRRVEESEAAAVLASQAKSEFLANMSHELRTPLNAIIGFSEMLNSGYFGPLNPKQKERINDINLCGSHLLQLISDILEFSKGEAGKLELNEEKVNLTDIVNETLRMMNEKIRSKGIHVSVDIEKGLPRIWCDKRKIRQIMLNLMSNSIKFTPENGTVKITLSLDGSRNMNMIVADTGIGIPEEKIALAMSVFGQVHRQQSHEGTGLGLPLCKMFAELHGGKMAVGSTPGEGTTIRVTLPRQRIIFHEEEVRGFKPHATDGAPKDRRKPPTE